MSHDAAKYLALAMFGTHLSFHDADDILSCKVRSYAFTFVDGLL